MQQFVDAKIMTKFGEFNIRVYHDNSGKETFALWSEKLDRKLPVLVRVHSECITGDLIGGLNCDCGEQFKKSLELINHEGGVLIYLRQEGRGIGLFEKMKAYQLQQNGHDTFEANVLLGHPPDGRTYEMVKTVLGDLQIGCIRLLTNNPSKVSEIAKFGIDVAERVPLLIESNAFNHHYFVTKKKKFHHFFEETHNHYFYQFHAETPDHIKQIGEFLQGNRKDPLLQICVGVTADHFTLRDKKKVSEVKAIFNACSLIEGFVPVLHFSFRDSIDILDELGIIKSNLPFVNRLQLNDLPTTEISYVKAATELFSTDIPLCDENFGIVHHEQFRNLIKHSYILLDNSKGRGIQESKESLMKKIDILLGYGLNDIAIFGGFGADQLEMYFELRRYYRINFSIDAESKLKTDEKIDIEKVKTYLQQLIRFDDPKQEAIEQTRTFLKQHRRSAWDKIVIRNHEFSIHPSVFHAGFFPSTAWFAEKIIEEVKNDHCFCEIGCGSGVISCLVALTNPKIHVVATDINPYASENTQLNADCLGLNDRMKITQGDVLEGISAEKYFDSIFWALPFGFLDPGASTTLEDIQVFDPGYRSIRKLFQTARRFLKPHGRLLIGFSSDLGHQDLLEELAKEFHVRLDRIDEHVIQETNKIKFELLLGTYLGI